MALRVDSMLPVLRWPLAYSFWASMMTRTLSLVDAVEGLAPRICLNDFAIVIAVGCGKYRIMEVGDICRCDVEGNDV